MNCLIDQIQSSSGDIYSAVDTKRKIGDIVPRGFIRPKAESWQIAKEWMEYLNEEQPISEVMARVELTDKSEVIYDDCPGMEITNLKILYIYRN